MKKPLEELCAMQGVNGAFLLSDEGELIAYSAPAIYDGDTLSQAAKKLSRATESLSVQHSDWDTLVAHFEDSKLFVLKAEKFTLCVIADDTLNLPFLNVALKVAKNKIDKKMSKRSQGENTASAYAGYPSRFSEAHRSQTPSQAASLGSGSVEYSGSDAGFQSNLAGSGAGIQDTSGMLWSGIGGTGMQTSAVSVADESSSAMLTKITNALAVFVGPMAKVFVKEAVRKICPTEPFNMGYLQQLLAELEQQHISDPEDLKEFRDEIHE